MIDFSALRTPAADGELLIEPDARHLEQLADENRRTLGAWDGPMLDGSIQELRDATRARLSEEGGSPLFMTGHQPDFIHAGVWAKQAVAAELRDRVGGSAWNLVVDEDVQHETSLVVPSQTKQGLEIRRVPYAERSHGRSFERIGALTAEEQSRFGDGVLEAMGGVYGSSFMPAFLGALGSSDSSAGWVGQIMAGRDAIDAALGVHLKSARVSKTWPAWHAADLMLNGCRFVEAYNASLAEYRRALNIRSPSRPVPDLGREGSRMELPLWAVSSEGVRRRVWIEPEVGSVRVFADEEAVGRLGVSELGSAESAAGAMERELSVQLRPRALVLTLWARMFACDLFIHGIGGALYDRITDGIIRRYYGVGPPAYGCVSATVHLGFETYPVGPADRQSAQWRVRDLSANPLRYVGAHGGREELARSLKGALEIGARLGDEDRHNRVARRRNFEETRRIKSELLGLGPDLMGRFVEAAREVDFQLAHNRMARGREYFIGLCPREKAARLGEAIRKRFG